jgi:glyoxylase-like metal-dependent hydrolase (beta-lactamase superfamily II)
MSGLAMAQGPAPLTPHPLSGNVSWVEGGGGNSGVIVGDKGVIVVDAKINQASGQELLADIAKLTPKPVDTVILTHSDRDHVNGLAAFPAGVTVIAQANNKKEQERAIAAGGKDAPPADHLPTRLVTQHKQNVQVDGVTFELLHWAPAHTSGDLVVFLPKQKVVFTGDIITNRPDPLIHLEKGGSSEGWIQTAKGIAALDADTFVPGHGNPETKAQVEEYVTHAEAKRARIKELVAQGKSLEEIKQAVGDAQQTQGGNGPVFATFTEVVYRELTNHHG